jgi:SNF2 family DNA or RNA helicase
LKGVGLTVRAGGVGITLTRAAFVLFVDESYTPADNAQAEDRACRYGQKRAVQVTYLVAEHPLDKRIHQILRAKQKMIDSVLTKVDR